MQKGMSALHSIADMWGATRYVRYVPIADIAHCSITKSALAISDCSIVRPSCYSALTTNSNLVRGEVGNRLDFQRSSSRTTASDGE